MKYLDEYRDQKIARALAAEIANFAPSLGCRWKSVAAKPTLLCVTVSTSYCLAVLNSSMAREPTGALAMSMPKVE
jgi:hypothetical protein